MNEHRRNAFETYYEDAASWNSDRIASMHSSRRIAWYIAAIAAAIALLEAIALVLLTPLKTVEPYTLMVDKTTGYVEALKPIEQEQVTPDTALTRSFLVQYVIAREGFDMASLNADYRKVALFSAGSARTSYLQQMQPSNPQSPLVLYPRSATIEVTVKSVSPLSANAALVRFDTVQSDGTGRSEPPSAWAAVVRYRYSDAPMSLADRFVNPLGFQVTGYRKDQEILADSTNVATAVGRASAPSRYGVPVPPPVPAAVPQ